jgi:AraC-type DNA-binding domain-containing proteins
MAKKVINSINLKQKSNFPYLVLNVKDAQSFPLNPGFKVMHWHEDLQFVYVSSGKITFSILGKTNLVIHGGEGLFINKEVAHLIIPAPHSHYHSFIFPDYFLEFYFNSPAQTIVSSVLNNEDFNFYMFKSDAEWKKDILELLKKLIGFENNKNNLYSYQVLVTLVTIWLDMAQHIHPIQDQKTDKVITKRMNIFLNYIQNHFSEKITLETLAASANVSKSESLRCFKTTLKVTPYEYLIEYRLNQATKLLQETDLPVNVIALKVGFPQASHFTEVFKSKTGLTPSKYRNS